MKDQRLSFTFEVDEKKKTWNDYPDYLRTNFESLISTLPDKIQEGSLWNVLTHNSQMASKELLSKLTLDKSGRSKSFVSLQAAYRSSSYHEYGIWLYGWSEYN